VEAQTDIQTYLEQGKEALSHGQGREAAIAYAHAAQLDPDNPQVHLGLAEANMALGNYGVVQLACRRVQELQPNGGAEGMTAQALLDLLDHRYERAQEYIDKAIELSPGVAYMYALRSYLLRALGQDYDANLARARAARLAFGAHFENCFPPMEERYSSGYRAAPALPSHPDTNSTPENRENGSQQRQKSAEPSWQRPNQMQRQIIRTRFALSRYANLVTYALIAINVIIYLIMAALSGSLNITTQVLVNFGAQVNPFVAQGQFWRIFTAMFLHFSIFHIGLNMLSLFFIGSAVEVFYGKWRYLAIYLLSGIIGGIVTYALGPNAPIISAGASGAIFGVFGALGVFYFTNRRALGGYGAGAIGNWVFWLALNIVFDVSSPNIGLADHIGGLIAGIVIAALLMPRWGRRRM
jgi:membrane associated rhomboid family serine protease